MSRPVDLEFSLVFVRGLMVAGGLGFLVGTFIMLSTKDAEWGIGGVVFGGIFGAGIGLLVGALSSLLGLVLHSFAQSHSPRLQPAAAAVGAGTGVFIPYAAFANGAVLQPGSWPFLLAVVIAALLGFLLTRPLRSQERRPEPDK